MGEEESQTRPESGWDSRFAVGGDGWNRISMLQNPAGIGCVVSAGAHRIGPVGETRFTTDCGGWTKVDELSVGGGFGSIRPLNQKFVPIPWSGAGPVEVTIQWPSGAVQTVMVTEDTGEWTLQEPDWKVWSQEEDTFILTVKPVLKNEAGIVAPLQLTLSDGTEWPFEESGVGVFSVALPEENGGLNGILEDASGSRVGQVQVPYPGAPSVRVYPSRLVAGQVASIRFSSQSIYAEGLAGGWSVEEASSSSRTREQAATCDPVPHRGGQPTQCRKRFPAAGVGFGRWSRLGPSQTRVRYENHFVDTSGVGPPSKRSG